MSMPVCRGSDCWTVVPHVLPARDPDGNVECDRIRELVVAAWCPKCPQLSVKFDHDPNKPMFEVNGALMIAT